jgi:2-polyprenyl-6-methoxyphenol hydroxylase-like FAD-dependent oxidoreductase
VLAVLALRGDDTRQPTHLSSRIASAMREAGSDLDGLAEHVESDQNPYLSRFTQTRARSWWTSRTILIGDAAHCIDPLSGLGAHASLLGAARLSHALRERATLSEAAAQYESRMRPFVRLSQAMTARTVESIVHPPGHSGARAAAGMLREAGALVPHLLTDRERARLFGTLAPSHEDNFLVGQQ